MPDLPQVLNDWKLALSQVDYDSIEDLQRLAQTAGDLHAVIVRTQERLRAQATDQLRRLHGISVQVTSREQIGDLFVVTARATITDTGRTDESIGAVNTLNLKGEALANAMMKAETKAKRRVTLSIAGLGWLDESEAGSVPDAQEARVNTETGEITESSPNAALSRLGLAMLKANLTEAQTLLRARVLFGEGVTQIPHLTDQQIEQLIEELEGA